MDAARVVGSGLCFLGQSTFDALTFGILLDSVGRSCEEVRGGRGGPPFSGVKSPSMNATMTGAVAVCNAARVVPRLETVKYSCRRMSSTEKSTF